MKKLLLGLLLVIGLSIPCQAAITNIQRTACNSGATSGSTTCTITTTTSGGHLGVFIMQEWFRSDGPGTPTMSGCSDTWTQAFTGNSSSRNSVWYIANMSAGCTGVVTHSNTQTSEIFLEYAGPATSSPLDTVVSAVVNLPTKTLASNTLVSSQTDLAIAWAYNPTRSAAGFTAADVWVGLTDSPNSSAARDLVSEDILDGWGQFTANMTQTNSDSSRVGLILFKDATAGTAPSPVLPSFLSNIETGNDGDQVTVALMSTGTKGGNCGAWAQSGIPSSSFVISTGVTGEPNIKSITVNGTTYNTAGTRGLRYDPAGSQLYVQCQFASTVASASSTGCFKTPANTTDGVTYSLLGFDGQSANDRAYLNIYNTGGVPGSFGAQLETFGGGSATTLLSGSTWYCYALLYASGATHKLQIYDANGATFGSELTHAATGSNNAADFFIGQAHLQTGTALNYLYVDNAAVDVVNATYPIALSTAAGPPTGSLMMMGLGR